LCLTLCCGCLDPELDLAEEADDHDPLQDLTGEALTPSGEASEASEDSLQGVLGPDGLDPEVTITTAPWRWRSTDEIEINIRCNVRTVMLNHIGHKNIHDSTMLTYVLVRLGYEMVGVQYYLRPFVHDLI
jgi:hypothetical protein